MQKYVKNLNEFLNENLNKNKIGETIINEAFQSGILSNLAKQQDVLIQIQTLAKKGIDLFNIQDDMISKVDGTKAWKYKTDNFIKFWFQGEKFAMVTVGNKRVDMWLNPTRAKYARAGNYEFKNWTGKDLKQLSHAFIIDLTLMPKSSALKAARNAAKQGATSYLTNEFIKKSNIERYRKTLADSQFSDGSELNVITNATKYVQQLVDTYAPLSVVINPPSDSFYYSYIKDYTKKLLEYIKEIEDNSYDLEKVVNDDWGRAITIKKELKSILQRIKDYNSSYLKYKHPASDFCTLMTGQGFYIDFKEWLIENSGMEVSNFLTTIEELNTWSNKNIPNFISSLKFTTIVELELFADIMYNIGRDYGDLNRTLASLNFIYGIWKKAGGKSATPAEVFGEEPVTKDNYVERAISSWNNVKKITGKTEILKRKLTAIQKITATV